MTRNAETEKSTVKQNLKICEEAIREAGFPALSVELGVEPQGIDHMERQAINIMLGELILCSFDKELPIDKKQAIETITKEMNFIKSGFLG